MSVVELILVIIATVSLAVFFASIGFLLIAAASKRTEDSAPKQGEEKPTPKTQKRERPLLKTLGRWLKKGLLIGLMLIVFLIIFMIWDDFKVWFAEWFAGSDAGELLGWQAETIETWLWLVVSSAVALYVLWRVPNKIWAQLVSAVVAVIALIVIALSLTTGETIFSIVDGSATENRANRACVTQRDLRHAKFDQIGRVMNVCRKEGVLYVFVQPGQKLEFSFSDRFKEEHQQTIAKRQVPQFITILPPRTWHNPAPGTPAYKLVPRQSIPSKQYVAAWDSTGLTQIELFVRSVK